MGVMGLMNDAEEAEAHQAERPDHHPVEFIEATIFTEQSVGSFVQTDQRAMHQMSNHNHKQRRHPDEAVSNRQCQHRVRENQSENEKLKRALQDPMRVVRFTKVVGDGDSVHGRRFSRSEIRDSGERQIPARIL